MELHWADNASYAYVPNEVAFLENILSVWSNYVAWNNFTWLKEYEHLIGEK